MLEDGKRVWMCGEGEWFDYGDSTEWNAAFPEHRSPDASYLMSVKRCPNCGRHQSGRGCGFYDLQKVMP